MYGNYWDYHKRPGEVAIGAGDRPNNLDANAFEPDPQAFNVYSGGPIMDLINKQKKGFSLSQEELYKVNLFNNGFIDSNGNPTGKRGAPRFFA